MDSTSTGDESAFREMLAHETTSVADRLTAYLEKQGYLPFMAHWDESLETWVNRAARYLIAGLDACPQELMPGPPTPTLPWRQFAVFEAEQRQRSGLSLDVYLGILKYLRWSFRDRALTLDLPCDIKKWRCQYIRQFFNQTEVILVGEWIEAADRNRQQIEEKIQQAQKLESLGVLAGGIAHDFNNALMTILGNVELSLMDVSPVSPIRSNLEDIEHAARRAADLCRQLLAYAGKGRYVVEPINLSTLIEEMRHMLTAAVDPTCVIRYNLSPSLSDISGDASQLRQVILNLVRNASEALGEAGNGTVSISTGVMECDTAYFQEFCYENLPSNGPYAYIEVSDTGPGMDIEVRKRIFEPFFTTKYTGRGLGMPAVLGIVRGHGGAVKIYTELGRGTTCKVLFPLMADFQTIAPEQPEAAKGQGCILVVDDEPALRAVALRMLEKGGYEGIEAASGMEAVEIYRARQNEIRGVLLDLTMPEMDGLATFQALRRICPTVPVLLSSGYNEFDATERFAGRELAGFLQKPYHLQTLLDHLKLILNPKG